MQSLLQDVFEELDRASICHCLLRDHDRLGDLGRRAELDVLLQADQLPRLRELLARRGFAALPSRGHEPHHFFAAYDANADAWLKLDVVTAIAYGYPVHALPTALAPGCLERRRRSGSTWVLAPEDELVTLLLHCLLDKRCFPDHRRARLAELCAEVTDEPYLSARLAACGSPGLSWPRLREQVEAGRWRELLAERPAVVACLAGPWQGRRCVREVQDRGLRKLDRLDRALRPRLPVVALLAPDGAGKSTLSAGVRRGFFYPVHEEYMGLYPTHRVNGQGRPPRRPPPGMGLTLRLLRQWRRYLRARYRQAKGELVVFDRYAYDALLPAPRRLGTLGRARRWLLARACPPPDLALLLDVPGEVLFARKGEHDPERLEAQRQWYLALQARRPEIVRLDATTDAETVRRTAIAFIWRDYARRTGLRNGHGG